MKRGEWKQKLYAVLVTPGASAGVKCPQGSLGVVLLTDMRVPLWGDWGRFSPTCGAKI